MLLSAWRARYSLATVTVFIARRPLIKPADGRQGLLFAAASPYHTLTDLSCYECANPCASHLDHTYSETRNCKIAAKVRLLKGLALPRPRHVAIHTNPGLPLSTSKPTDEMFLNCQFASEHYDISAFPIQNN